MSKEEHCKKRLEPVQRVSVDMLSLKNIVEVQTEIYVVFWSLLSILISFKSIQMDQDNCGKNNNCNIYEYIHFRHIFCEINYILVL